MCNIMYRLTVIDIHTNKAHPTIFTLLFSFMWSRETTKPLSIRLYTEALAVMQDGGILMKKASDISSPLWKEHSFKQKQQRKQVKQTCQRITDRLYWVWSYYRPGVFCYDACDERQRCPHNVQRRVPRSELSHVCFIWQCQASHQSYGRTLWIFYESDVV